MMKTPHYLLTYLLTYLKVSGKVIKPDVAFDFPGKPGDKGVVDSAKGTISFADGNVWTKIG